MRQLSLFVLVLALGCRGGGYDDDEALHGYKTPSVDRCAAAPIGTEQWPAWDPGSKYAERVASAVEAYHADHHDWKLYYHPGGYRADGEFVTFSGFATLGPEVKLDENGVPLILVNGQWVYNPVTISQFAMYHHSLHLRGGELQPNFWAAVRKLQDMQGPDGALRYDYDFDTMEAGFASGMAQGEVLSVFSRAYRISPEPDLIEAGNTALRFLLIPVEEGGVRGSLNDLHPSLKNYLSLYEYDLALSPHTLNGFLFATFGLYDWSQLEAPGADNELADTMFKCATHTVASSLHYYDIGGYSAYDVGHILHGREPSAGGPNGAVYHKIHIAQLVALHSITQRPELLYWATVWANSVSQPIP